jgi:ribosomal protein L11 methylase PrmA
VDYLELSLAVQAAAVDTAADMLRRHVPAGVSIEPLAEPIDEDGGARIDPEAPVRLRAWLPADAESRAAVAVLRKELRALDGIRRPLHARTVHDASWVETWKKHFRTMRIGRSIVIKPSWRTYSPRKNDVVLELDPGMAFGTGQHATTQLCLEAIEELLPPSAGSSCGASVGMTFLGSPSGAGPSGKSPVALYRLGNAPPVMRSSLMMYERPCALWPVMMRRTPGFKSRPAVGAPD